MLTQDNSAQAVSPELNVWRGAIKTIQFTWRIVSTGNHKVIETDKVIETFSVHLMEMYLCIFVIEALQNSAKYQHTFSS